MTPPSPSPRTESVWVRDSRTGFIVGYITPTNKIQRVMCADRFAHRAERERRAMGLKQYFAGEQ